MTRKSLGELIRKYREQTVTEEEKAALEKWYLHHAAKQEDRLPEGKYEDVEAEIWARIRQNKQQRTIRPLFKIAVAAAIVLALGAGLYQYTRQQPRSMHTLADIRPGSTRARLIRADGTTLVLSAAQNGSVIKDPSGADGSLQTVATPKGGQYHFILPDGSHVWLNAHSSLSYPPDFGGRERRVVLEGEAYFEVAHDRSKPFRVHTRAREIEVLGTHFNVSSYNDDTVSKISLLEGRIRVSEKLGGKTRLLKPGQQLEASLTATVVKPAPVEQAIDWKLGFFQFKNENVQSIMLKLGRWYDVDVVYKGDIPPQELEGTISRSQNLSKVLQMLEATGVVRFEVRGRKILVSAGTS